VRAQICYGASLWETFFASLTSVAAATSRVICSFPVPDVPFDPDRLQLRIDAGLKQTNIGSVGSLADCGPLPQFAYDDWDHPTRMLLCGSACDKVNAVVGPNRPGKLSAVVECL